MNASLPVLLVLSMASVSAPQAVGQIAPVVTPAQSMDDDDPIDPGFAISQMGPMVLIPDRMGEASRRHWIQLNRDECGTLQGIEDGRSMLNRSAYGGDGFVDEDQDDPAFAKELMFDQWLSAHSSIAEVNGAIDHWCNEGDQDGLSDIDTSDIA
jgi:hypothetical protein